MTDFTSGGNITPVPGTHYSPGVPVSGVSQVQTLTSTATGGTFALTLSGYKTGPIAWNASAAVIAAALALLPIVSASTNIVGAGGPLNTTPVTITMQNDLGGLNLPLIIVDNSLATGGTVVPTITTAGVQGSFRGCPVGTMLVDTHVGKLYINTGTNTVPTWTVVGSQS